LEPDGFFPSGPVRSKSGRFIFDVKLTKIRQKTRQKSSSVQPAELAKIQFRPAGPVPTLVLGAVFSHMGWSFL
jgi:hypothetical protein